MDGPDHLASITPKELKSLVDDIRRAEVMKGSYKKNIQKEEIEMRKISRKSLIYTKNFEAGYLIKMDDISSSRPGTGLTGDKISLILNKKLKRKVYKKNNVKLNDFKH